MKGRRRLAILGCLVSIPSLVAGACADPDADPATPGPSPGVERTWSFAGASRATTDGPGEVTVFWTSATAPVEYEIHLLSSAAESDSGDAPVAVASATATQHTLAGLPVGESVRILVRARDATGRRDDNAAIVSAATGLSPIDPMEVWSRDLPYGAFSSPALADFDGDGVLDMVFGTGAHNVRGEVVALSGVDGHEIWMRQVTGEMVGSPATLDASGDGLEDVVIGGRDVELRALNGRDGGLLWTFEASAHMATPVVADIRGRPGVFVTVGGLGPLRADEEGGGDRSDPAYHMDRWSPGRLYGIDGRTGAELGRLETEDFEYYASPALGDLDGDGVPEIVVGSGGHDKPGEVFVVDLEGWGRRWGRPSGRKGVVASPCLADLDGDGLLDVVAASEDQHVAAYRGVDGQLLWRWDDPGREFVASPSIGWSHRAPTPSVLVAGSQGTWDDGYRDGRRVLLDGRTGSAQWEHVADARFLLATPLWADLDGNDLDDLILAEVEFNPRFGLFWTRILLLHGATGEELGRIEQDAAVISTPIVSDIDDDGDLDLMWVGFQGPLDQEGALPGRVGRIEIGAALPRRGISWDRFRGNAANSGALTTPPPPHQGVASP